MLNAANEVAVAAFLQQRMKFTAIPEVIERTLDLIPAGSDMILSELLNIDAEARARAEQIVREMV